jgi:hypothetical protein
MPDARGLGQRNAATAGCDPGRTKSCKNTTSDFAKRHKSELNRTIAERRGPTPAGSLMAQTVHR